MELQNISDHPQFNKRKLRKTFEYFKLWFGFLFGADEY